MEFERSLFRVYERSIAGLAFDSPGDSSFQSESTEVDLHRDSLPSGENPWRRRLRVAQTRAASASRWMRGNKTRLFMHACLWISVCSVALTMCLHYRFVGDHACLSETLSRAGYRSAVLLGRNASEADSEGRLRSDDVLHLEAWGETYEYAVDPVFLLFPEELRADHAIRVVNLTFPENCLSRSERWVLSRFVGFEEVVVNNLMFGLSRASETSEEEEEAAPGSLRRGRETWSWSSQTARPTIVDRWLRNLAALHRSLLTLFLVSSVTGLMVRVSVSSGVSVMFPAVSFLRWMGFPQVDARTLTLSYPWIGADAEILEATGQSITPLIRAHLLTVLVVYSMYEACEFAWKRWFYGFKAQPAGIEVNVFALMVGIEYFLMVFARSALTVRVLPKIIMLEMIVFHVYAFAVPYGFTRTLLAGLWSSLGFWTTWFLIECESKALRRGQLSLATPRMFYSVLPAPQWPIALPPIWSVFYDLNRAERGIHDGPPPVLDHLEGADPSTRGSGGANQVGIMREGGGGEDDERDPEAGIAAANPRPERVAAATAPTHRRTSNAGLAALYGASSADPGHSNV